MSDNEDIFEPYFDWNAISDQMLEDTHSAAATYRRAIDRFLGQKSKQNMAEFMKTQQALSQTVGLVERAIFIVPTMVHVAGEPFAGENEDGDATITQICSRCKRVLMLWTANQAAFIPGHGAIELEPEHMTWWKAGQRIALSKDQMHSYDVPPDRGLKPYEHPCPDFNGMGLT